MLFRSHQTAASPPPPLPLMPDGIDPESRAGCMVNQGGMNQLHLNTKNKGVSRCVRGGEGGLWLAGLTVCVCAQVCVCACVQGGGAEAWRATDSEGYSDRVLCSVSGHRQVM